MSLKNYSKWAAVTGTVMILIVKYIIRLYDIAPQMDKDRQAMGV